MSPAGRADADAPITVIAILGMAFSGSTLLNFVLDSHSQIYGGGELHWFITTQGQQVDWQLACTECGYDCEYWSTDTVGSLKEENYYEQVAALMGARIIADSSKDPPWFARMAAAHRDRPVRFVYVVMAKHPVRHISSFALRFAEAGFPQISRKQRWLTKLKGGSLLELEAERWIQPTVTYYDQVRRDLEAQAGPGDLILEMRYEDLVLETEKTVQPILDAVGLNFEPAMLSPMDRPHHQIGGNASTVFSRSRTWTKDSDISSKLRKSYYGRNRGMFVDQKYKEVFSDSYTARLVADPDLVALCDRLGYAAAPDADRV